MQLDFFSRIRDGKVMTQRDASTVPYVYQVRLRRDLATTSLFRASLQGRLDPHPRLVTVIAIAKFILRTNSWWQGDSQMYTTENLKKRKRLLFHPEIGKAIRAFWNVLDLTKDSCGCIRMSDFMVMNIKIQKALMPGLRINVRDTQIVCLIILAVLDLRYIFALSLLFDYDNRFLDATFEITNSETLRNEKSIAK